MSNIPSLSKLSLAPADVSAPEAKAPTLDPNAEEREDGEITEPNWETALGIVAKALLENLDPERCKDPAKMCIASRAFNKEWCQNPLFWFALLEKMGWSVCMITRTTSYEDNPDAERAGFQPAFKRVTTTLEVPTKDTARPPLWTFKQEAYDAKLAEALEAQEQWQVVPADERLVFDFDWGDYAEFWEDNRAAVDAYYRGHRQNLVALLEAHPEEQTASLECLRDQYRRCCEATERRGQEPGWRGNPVRRQGDPLPIVKADDQQGRQALTFRDGRAGMFDSAMFLGSVDPATGMAQGSGVLMESYGYDLNERRVPIYKGPWVDGMRHGPGVETYYEGDHYGDPIVDGYDSNLKVVFTGEFKWNARHGKGRVEWYRTRRPGNGGAPVEERVKWVEGEWRNDARHGAFEEWRMSTGDPAQAAEVPIQASNWVGRIVGEYVRGRMRTGTSYWDTGQKQYEGQWLTSRDLKRTLMQGEGTFYSRSGIKVFTGTFSNDMPQGQGRLFHKDGETPYYDGQWRNGTWHGRGFHYNRNGALRYEGEFGPDPAAMFGAANMFGGMGGWGGGNDPPVETAATGWGPANVPANAAAGMQGATIWPLFEGVRNGTGIGYERNGLPAYNGDWKNGKREGFGISVSVDGDYTEYDGDWKDDKKNGTGKSYFPKLQPGTEEQFVSYEGEWRDNLRWGQGTSYDEEGNIVHQGEWEDGLPYPSQGGE